MPSSASLVLQTPHLMASMQLQVQYLSKRHGTCGQPQNQHASCAAALKTSRSSRLHPSTRPSSASSKPHPHLYGSHQTSTQQSSSPHKTTQSSSAKAQKQKSITTQMYQICALSGTCFRPRNAHQLLQQARRWSSSPTHQCGRRVKTRASSRTISTGS
jgi:hypothetical protein